MAGPGGVQLPTIPLTQTAQSALSLRPGQTLQTTVQSAPNGSLFIQVGGVRVPFQSDVLLAAGQTVLLEVVARRGGVQLRVLPQQQGAPAAQGGPQRSPAPGQPQPQTPAAQTSTAPPASGQPNAPGQPPAAQNPNAPNAAPAQMTHSAQVASQPAAASAAAFPAAASSGQQAAVQQTFSNPLAALVASAVRALGASVPAESAAQLLPLNLPPGAEAVRQLLAVLLTRGRTGQDLQLIQETVTQAAVQGAITQDAAGELAQVVARLLLTGDDAAEAVLNQLTARSAGPLEARLALALARGNVDQVLREMGQDLRNMLRNLLRNETLDENLSANGRLEAFRAAVHRVLDRLTGRELQNLRSLEQPYQFLEVPVAPGSGFRHAQVHFFGDRSGGKQRFDPANASVVLDVSLTRLGDLWVNLNIARGHCTCSFRAKESAALEMLETSSDELRGALEQAGYPGAEVRVGQWQGDRLDELVRLAERFSGVNIDA